MTFKTYHDFVSSLPSDALLGNLVWFTISQADVPFDQVDTELARFNLSSDGMRKRIRPVDAFSKATKAVAKNFGKQEDGLSSALLVRDVGQNDEMVYRHVMLERAQYKAGKKRQLVYQQVAEMILSRGGIDEKGKYKDYAVKATRVPTVGIDFTDQEEEWLNEKIPQVEPEFEHQMTHLDSHAIRSYVRTQVTNLQAILAKESGGVYFIPEAYTEDLRRLRSWVESIGSSMDLTPLVNFDESRNMLVSAATEDAIREVHQIGNEVTKILEDPDRSVRETTYEKFVERSMEVGSRLNEYRTLLDHTLGDTDVVMQAFKKQLLRLGERVEKKTKATA